MCWKIYVGQRNRGENLWTIQITKDQSRFSENKDYIGECFEKFAYICDRKGVFSDIKFRSIDEGRKKGFFIVKEEVVVESQNEIKLQRTIFSELKGVKDSSKKAMLEWME
jgi:hypothetical protein